MTGPSPAYVALALVPGIGHRRLRSLLSRFPDAAADLAATQAELEDVPGVSRAGATAVLGADPAKAERLLARTRELGGVVLAPDDQGFPPVLRDIPEGCAKKNKEGVTRLRSPPPRRPSGSRAA